MSIRVVSSFAFIVAGAAIFATAAPPLADRHAPQLAPVASSFADQLVADAMAGVGDPCGYPNPNCSLGLACCSGICRDLKTDENNCGSCGTTCDSGEECGTLNANPAVGPFVCLCGGGPGCSGSDTCCPTTGGCVDLKTDEDNCGACDDPCGENAVCNWWSCGCSLLAYPDECNGDCTNFDSDADNCGGCGVECAAGESCDSGSCTCDSSSDCASGEYCIDGVCGDPPPCDDHDDCPNYFVCDSCTADTNASCSPGGSCVENGDLLGSASTKHYKVEEVDYQPVSNFVWGCVGTRGCLCNINGRVEPGKTLGFLCVADTKTCNTGCADLSVFTGGQEAPVP